ncbi:hypothetical protein SCORR_v1c07080 [Spiroplasma corruscae]|uniref:Uncharacterized protein n=1 Tax=Spiroplasma corruscae TaxID=216934 RepID=A0A222EPM7_9MOLU|nr:hypothetical protein [Spiroplasma corruscae]ASP28480.1 hypothetical protein SCORR_v1c07080 [Spiroplasma corruscae]
MKKLLATFTMFIILIVNIFTWNLKSTQYKNEFQNLYTYKDSLNQLTNSKYDLNSYLWGGLSLQYFLYKHSDITKNDEANVLWNKLKGNQNLSQEYYYMSLMSSLITISIYGMTSYQEFFAESYTKWTSTNDEAKNKSWELVNYYFLNIYPVLKNTISGYINNDKMMKVIDEDFEKDTSKALIYETNKQTKEMKATDLNYDTDDQVGFSNNKENTRYPYASNALYLAYLSSVNNGNLSFNYGNSYITSSESLKFYYNSINSDDFAKLTVFMNDTYTKASNESITNYNNLISSNEKKFQDFSDMNSYFLEHTSSKTTKKGANIFLEDSINDMANYYSWSDSRKEKFKKQFLDLINATLSITNLYSLNETNKEAFTYNIISIIFSPDTDIVDQSGKNTGVMGYTSMAGNLESSNEDALGVYFSYIVYNGEAFNLDTKNGIDSAKQEYVNNWWSSANIFTTLNHEMGHAVDSFLGENNNIYKSMNSAYNSLINQYPIAEGSKPLYKGKVFGFDGNTYENDFDGNKIIFIVLGVAVGISIIIGVTAVLISKRKTNLKTPK